MRGSNPQRFLKPHFTPFWPKEDQKIDFSTTDSELPVPTMESSNAKHKQQDLVTVFSRDAAYQTIAPSVGITDRHAKTSTAPPTGSPTLAPKAGYRHRPEDDILVQTLTQSNYSEAPRVNNPPVLPPLASTSANARTTSLNNLPIEIHNTILDYLAGSMGSLSSSSSRCTRRDWSKSCRHPRRKQLSDLALVSGTWRQLLQERLYRHSELLQNPILKGYS